MIILDQIKSIIENVRNVKKRQKRTKKSLGSLDAEQLMENYLHSPGVKTAGKKQIRLIPTRANNKIL
tara:strand:- start:230 stop:430 length:201 start_codon:yes stop_codon:yes gene_type:complete